MIFPVHLSSTGWQSSAAHHTTARLSPPFPEHSSSQGRRRKIHTRKHRQKHKNTEFGKRRAMGPQEESTVKPIPTSSPSPLCVLGRIHRRSGQSKGWPSLGWLMGTFRVPAPEKPNWAGAFLPLPRRGFGGHDTIEMKSSPYPRCWVLTCRLMPTMERRTLPQLGHRHLYITFTEFWRRDGLCHPLHSGSIPSTGLQLTPPVL